MRAPLDPKILEKVISERMTSNAIGCKERYIHGEYGETLYCDKNGLIHEDGPSGKIVDYIGYTNEQLEKMKTLNSIAPRPR
jgi:hypothetical protein